MKSVKMQTILSAAVAVCAFLSTTYAHGATLYSCVFENATRGERFEVRLREDGNEGTLAYKLPAELGMTDCNLPRSFEPIFLHSFEVFSSLE